MYTNPASTDAGEFVLSGGACFVARRLQLSAVAVLLCILWPGAVHLDKARFFLFCLIRTRTAYCVNEARVPQLLLYQ